MKTVAMAFKRLILVARCSILRWRQVNGADIMKAIDTGGGT